MLIFRIFICLGFSILIVSSCRTQASQSSGESVDAIAKKYLNSEVFERKDNVLKSYSLFSFDNGTFTKYLVIRLADKEVVYQSRVRGRISWINEYELKQFSVPEIIRDNEDINRFIKIIDVTSSRN